MATYYQIENQTGATAISAVAPVVRFSMAFAEISTQLLFIN